MVEYGINYDNNSCRYNLNADRIELAIEPYDIDIFTDQELIDYISDNIVHEFVHSILFKMFNITVTKLFDVIEENFRIFPVYHTRSIDYNNTSINNGSVRYTYSEYINKHGFNALLDYYHISEDQLEEARRLTKLHSDKITVRV